MMCDIYQPNIRRRSLLLLLGIWFVLLSGSAQTGTMYENSYSPVQAEFTNSRIRPEADLQNAYLANPALLHRMVEARRYFFIDNLQQKPLQPRTLFVTTEGSMGKYEGDYLPVQGKDFRDLTIRANGYARTARSTFFGKADFTFGEHKHVGWNTQRYPELYWPYLMADSTGGNYHYEQYNLMGAYSFRLRKVDLGVSGEYKGDFAFKQNDPRIENITTWLTLKAGAAYEYRKQLFSVETEYTLHRQHTDVKHFRSGQFTGFFVEYGFGMFDYIHSPVFNYTKQQQHINRFGTTLAYHSDPSKPLRINVGVKYSQDRMTTEESIYKLNLYRALTHQLKVDYGMLWNNRWGGVVWRVAIDADRRNGREYLFERYVSSTVDGVEVYDYKRIGHQDRYRLERLDAQSDLKLSRYFRKYTLSVLASADYFSRNETYKEKNFRIKNTLFTPAAGLEAGYRHKGLDVQLKGTWGKRIVLDHTYQVDVELEKQTEFQHAFTTYAYYGHEGSVWTAELSAAKEYAFGRIGLQAQLFRVHARRLSDIRYDPQRLADAVPRATRNVISTDPDKHHVQWFKVGAFVEF